jgi:hypothetical protein
MFPQQNVALFCHERYMVPCTQLWFNHLNNVKGKEWKLLCYQMLILLSTGFRERLQISKLILLWFTLIMRYIVLVETNINLCRIWGFHSGGYEEYYLLATCLLAGLLNYFSTLKMEAIRSYETSGATQWTTRRHIPEDDTLHNINLIWKILVFITFIKYSERKQIFTAYFSAVW